MTKADIHPEHLVGNEESEHGGEEKAQLNADLKAMREMVETLASDRAEVATLQARHGEVYRAMRDTPEGRRVKRIEGLLRAAEEKLAATPLAKELERVESQLTSVEKNEKAVYDDTREFAVYMYQTWGGKKPHDAVGVSVPIGAEVLSDQGLKEWLVERDAWALLGFNMKPLTEYLKGRKAADMPDPKWKGKAVARLIEKPFAKVSKDLSQWVPQVDREVDLEAMTTEEAEALGVDIPSSVGVEDRLPF